MPLFHDKWVLSFMEIQILAPKFRAFWPLTASQFGLCLPGSWGKIKTGLTEQA